ncbi:hypothetical protein MTR_3g035120 [Medicago truncatula]|uniref:Uncharacterized protein n=1 Tax=Medicago truncatula TaxID=3880 RepID=G7IZP0_MEDTR|nr:hypothetical protein MTR_3g035120 [Medicago truncatula]
MSNLRHVSEFAELDGGGVFSGKKKFYKDAIQTENDLYDRDFQKKSKSENNLKTASNEKLL